MQTYPAKATRQAIAALKTVEDIQATFAEVIKKESGAVVSVCYRWDHKWTISGSREDAAKAVEWLIKYKVMVLEDQVFDEELAEAFYYMEKAQ